MWPGQQRTINYWDHAEAGLGPSAGCLHRTRLFGAGKSVSDVNGTASFFCRGGIPAWGGWMRRRPAGPRLGGGRLRREDTICQAADRLAYSPPMAFPPSTVDNTAQHVQPCNRACGGGGEGGSGHRKSVTCKMGQSLYYKDVKTWNTKC